LNEKTVTPAPSTTMSEGKSGKEEKLSENARNALAEARARRATIDGKTTLTSNEIAGRGGLEPTRYDDWEIKGITSDF